MVNRYPLTDEQFRQLLLCQGWEINDVPPEISPKIPGLVRLNETIAVMASGSTDDPRILNDISAIAGVDVLAHETKPKEDEPEGNAYHFAIQKTKDTRCPFIMYGPFKSGTVVGHWFDADDLDSYWTSSGEPEVG